MKTAAKDLLKFIGKSSQNEDQKGSTKIDNMLGWSNDLEDPKLADKAQELVSSLLHLYDISNLDSGELMEIWKLAKKPQSEIYIDGEMIWVADDTQAVAAKLQDFARKNKLEIPKF